MAQCRNYMTGEDCPELYKCVDEGDEIRVRMSMKELDQYCFYCLATPGVRKIGTVAGWTGRTPKWCPKGRDGV